MPQCDWTVKGEYQLVFTPKRVGGEYQSDIHPLEGKR